jgi:hypothetical protein
MDSLEKYIIDNRQEFNNVEPPADLFEGIAFEADEHVTIPLYKKLAKWSVRAAAAILIFASAWLLNDLRDHNDQVAKIDDQSLEIIKELKEAEAFYNARITHNKHRIASFASNNPGIMESVNTDLEQLDAVYNELKNDLGDNAANQEIVEAMIQNYRLKLDILEEILQQLEEKSNTNKKESISYEL